MRTFKRFIWLVTRDAGMALWWLIIAAILGVVGFSVLFTAGRYVFTPVGGWLRPYITEGMGEFPIHPTELGMQVIDAVIGCTAIVLVMWPVTCYVRKKWKEAYETRYED